MTHSAVERNPRSRPSYFHNLPDALISQPAGSDAFHITIIHPVCGDAKLHVCILRSAADIQTVCAVIIPEVLTSQAEQLRKRQHAKLYLSDSSRS